LPEPANSTSPLPPVVSAAANGWSGGSAVVADHGMPLFELARTPSRQTTSAAAKPDGATASGYGFDAPQGVASPTLGVTLGVARSTCAASEAKARTSRPPFDVVAGLACSGNRWSAVSLAVS
jgi:hypothetical protein